MLYEINVSEIERQESLSSSSEESSSEDNESS